MGKHHNRRERRRVERLNEPPRFSPRRYVDDVTHAWLHVVTEDRRRVLEAEEASFATYLDDRLAAHRGDPAGKVALLVALLSEVISRIHVLPIEPVISVVALRIACVKAPDGEVLKTPDLPPDPDGDCPKCDALLIEHDGEDEDDAACDGAIEIRDSKRRLTFAQVSAKAEAEQQPHHHGA